jgi:hypothetical protein
VPESRCEGAWKEIGNEFYKIYDAVKLPEGNCDFALFVLYKGVRSSFPLGSKMESNTQNCG